jgi:hypothetical protein
MGVRESGIVELRGVTFTNDKACKASQVHHFLGADYYFHVQLYSDTFGRKARVGQPMYTKLTTPKGVYTLNQVPWKRQWTGVCNGFNVTVTLKKIKGTLEFNRASQTE